MPPSNKLVHDAEKVATILLGTDIELRGDLFHNVAIILEIRAQYFTAGLFEKAAREYGRKTT